MVRLAHNVIAAAGLKNPGHAMTKRELINTLINAGYGPKKAKDWIEQYIEIGSIYHSSSDPETGLEFYYTKWWLGNDYVTARVCKPRVRVTPEGDE